MDPRQWQPPSELVFSNQTGAVAHCGLALELAQSMARAERQLAAAGRSNPNPARHVGVATAAQSTQQQEQLLQKYDIRIRWEKVDGGGGEPQQVEQAIYGSSAASANNQPPRGSLLRFVRHSDQALVFEPFRQLDFRPDIHAATYRCVASSAQMGATVVSRDMRVKAVIVPSAASGWNPAAAANQVGVAGGGGVIEVLDELVVEGNSAVFRCKLPSGAQDYLEVLDWVEYPSELALTYQSTTLANANLLFRPAGASNASAGQQLSQPSSSSSNQPTTGSQIIAQPSQVSYFVAPKSGDLHILNVYSNFNYRSYKCRCKNKLTGELISSINKGKLIVSGEFQSINHSTQSSKAL